jgi:hypothetical protein
MDEAKLKGLAGGFVQELARSSDLQEHAADHRRRCQRAAEVLTPERIPALTEAEVKALLLDSDAFGFWRDSDREFAKRLGKHGLDGMRQALLELATRGAGQLTPNDLNQIWGKGGLGTLLATEVLSWRFPDRYWPYSANSTLPSFKALGDDIKAAMPRGEKSGAYIYFALQPRMEQVRQALREAGLPEPNYLDTDLFLWWAKQTVPIQASGRAWLFQARSDQYDLDAALRRYRFDDWRVARFKKEVRKGHKVVMWKAGDERGIYGLADVVSDPYIRADGDLAVDLEFQGRLRQPILASAFENHPVLSGMTIMRQQQGTNFRLTNEQWAALQPLLGEIIPPDPDAADARGTYSARGHETTAPARRRYWRISPGEGAWAWEECRDGSLIAVGWVEAGDLAQVGPGSQQQIRERLEAAGIRQGPSLNHAAQQLWKFYAEMREGDSICVYGKKQVLGWGEVAGGYTFEQDGLRYPHRRAVRWASTEPVPVDGLSPGVQKKLQQRTTIVPLTEAEFGEVAGTSVIDGETQFDAASLAAREAVESLLPDEGVRRACLSVLADSIEIAHACAPGVWGITLRSDRTLCLNVGAMYAFEIGSNGVSIAIDRSRLTDADRARLEEFGQWGEYEFKRVPSAAELRIAPESLGDALASARPWHVSAIEGAAATVPVSHRTPYYKSHSPGVLAYVRTFLGRDLPDPEYGVEPAVEAHPSLRQSVACLGLLFTDWQLATFYTALQTKGFVILSGISGTGKTKLGQAFAEALPQPDDGDNHLFLPVRPDWRDSKALLGYYNPLTQTYEWTEFLRFVVRAAQSYEAKDGLAWFVILDEMNLAHVEYYFADLLSVLESGRDDDGWTKEPLRSSYPEGAESDPPPKELRLPPNLYVVGTVNVDETTQVFSPKVLDRAFTLELTEADFSNYPPQLDADQPDPSGLSDQQRHALLRDFTCDGAFARIDKHVIAEYVAKHPEARNRLQSLNSLLRSHDLHFGYRVFDEIVCFLAAAEQNGSWEDLDDWADPLDAAVLMKVLPKFHGSRGKLETPLRAVLAWCVNADAPDTELVNGALLQLDAGADVTGALAEVTFGCPRTAERVTRMLRALYTDGFAAFG